MRICYCLIYLLLLYTTVAAQSLKNIEWTNTLQAKQFTDAEGKSYSGKEELPLCTFELNAVPYSSIQPGNKIAVSFIAAQAFSPGYKGTITFKNSSNDTVVLSNVVPFGVSAHHVYITGKGDHPLSRTHIFIPGKIPLNVICPDNAWELGYSNIELDQPVTICALLRRDRSSVQSGERRRFETVLYPGGSVAYSFYADLYTGNWQEGLRLLFQKRYLYDLPSFDNSLFERKDLQWIRHSYVMHLLMTWDNNFYSAATEKYSLANFIQQGKKLYGGDEVIGIWPTWPSLGLDQRNQFDLFRNLPGGTKRLQQLADSLRKQGTRFFVCYNPWDESTRSEGHLAGLAQGASSKELQDAADKVRSGVVMYSEGMAVPKDMPGIVSGRVHNALYYPPVLNLNKFIKPEFAIFRVAELYKEPIQREIALSFFNGYGIEINSFAPGNAPWAEEQYKYLGRAARILRENTNNFTSGTITPLVTTSADSIWVNKWTAANKTIYTIYSIHPQGYKDALFQVQPTAGYHFVDLWHHKKIEPIRSGSSWMITAETDAFNKTYLATNNEGEVDCIAQLPELLHATIYGDQLQVRAQKGTVIKVWAGRPAYDKQPLLLKPGEHTLRLSEHFGWYEGDFVIQCFDADTLLDETVVTIIPGTPRRMSAVHSTTANHRTGTTPAGMVKIPAGTFIFKESHGDEFIPYPKQDVDSSFAMPSFYMDKYPVTNTQFKAFLSATHYKPADTVNFLKHWSHGAIPKGMEQYPVVYISYEDARAYATWAKRRLPTETEWQYAAQTPSLNEWPWKQQTPVTRKQEVVTETLTVTAIEGIDSTLCNLGSGLLYPVGSYPAGVNPYGLYDLVGCVWQLTNDVYRTGNYQYILLKGGSYFRPSGSWWYVQGGPRELHYRQFLLRVSPGFERNATVGFRCMRD
jgi:gamma-glutamyl hercynylcysteine S-oxide synthase